MRWGSWQWLFGYLQPSVENASLIREIKLVLKNYESKVVDLYGNIDISYSFFFLQRLGFIF